jgi:MFS family permease
MFADRRRLVLGAAALIVFVSLGMRHSFGLFLDPITRELYTADRHTFGLAVGVQNLVWGCLQPVAGMLADRFGGARVIFVGGLLYAGGLLCTSLIPGPLSLLLGFGLLVGAGLACTTYAVVLGLVGQRFAANERSRALGIATLGGSVGILASVPATMALIGQSGWRGALAVLALTAVLISLAAIPLGGKPALVRQHTPVTTTLGAAITHRGFILLTLGFSACGFQLAFVATHLPAVLGDRGLDVRVAGAALVTIAAANIIGTYVCGALGDRFRKKQLLALLYGVRAVAIALMLLPAPSVAGTFVFAVAIGLTWLGTVPLTGGLVAQIFGSRYLATLIGVVFLMHQVGAFFGAWLGGIAFDAHGSYQAIWWGMLVVSLLATIAHLCIDDHPLPTNGHLSHSPNLERPIHEARNPAHGSLQS